MCDPVTLGVLAASATEGAAAAGMVSGITAGTAASASLALAAGSTVMAGASAYQQAATQKAVAEHNATIAEYQAQNATARGEFEAQKARRDSDQLLGRQRSMMAARGLDLGVGTAAEVQDQTGFFSQMDQNIIRNNAAKEAWGTRAQGANFQAQADSINPLMQSAGTLMANGSTVAGKWYTYTKTS